MLSRQHNNHFIYGSWDMVEQCQDFLTETLDDARESLKLRHEAEVSHVVTEYLGALANAAYRWANLDGYPIEVDEMVELLVMKQQRYGTGNILAFGHRGLLVRTSDKVARANHMRENGHEADDEPLRDSLLDIIGYAVLADMLQLNWFQLPLLSDTQLKGPIEFVPRRGAGTKREKEAAELVDAAMSNEATRAAKWMRMVVEAVPSGTPEEDMLKAVGRLLDSGHDPDGVELRVEPHD